MKHLLQDLKNLNTASRWLLSISFTFSIGGFIVVPFIAVYLHNKLGFSLAFVSFQLTLKILSQQGMMLLGGFASDRRSPHFAMATGCGLRILSFLLYAAGRSEIVISLATVIFGLAAAFFVPASKSALSLSGSLNKSLMFSLRSAANNLGMALGGLLGAVLIDLPPFTLFLSAAVVQSICGLLLWLPATRTAPRTEAGASAATDASPRLLKHVLTMIGNPVINKMGGLHLIFTVLYAQLEFTLPIAVANHFSNQAVGLLFLMNTTAVFCLQIPLNYFLSTRISLEKTIFIGFCSVGLAMLGFFHMPALAPFLGLVVLYTIGELIIDPAVDALAASQVDQSEAGTLFGLLGTLGMAGGFAGNWLGSAYFTGPDGGHLWLICTAIAAIACAVLMFPSPLRRAHEQ